MAATGIKRGGGLIIFAGGSDNPYNYNGVGYDGNPSQPSDEVIAYAVADRRWHRLGRLPVATMDHRGLLQVGEHVAIAGGMRTGQRVTAEVLLVAIGTPAQSIE